VVWRATTEVAWPNPSPSPATKADYCVSTTPEAQKGQAFLDMMAKHYPEAVLRQCGDISMVDPAAGSCLDRVYGIKRSFGANKRELIGVVLPGAIPPFQIHPAGVHGVQAGGVLRRPGAFPPNPRLVSSGSRCEVCAS
jgi:hypothetical protein